MPGRLIAWPRTAWERLRRLLRRCLPGRWRRLGPLCGRGWRMIDGVPLHGLPALPGGSQLQPYRGLLSPRGLLWVQRPRMTSRWDRILLTEPN